MIAIIDVSGTNLTSLVNAINRLGFKGILTHDVDQLQTASHVILPGVGTARYGMDSLRSHNLIDVIKTLKQPLLGICLGMQLLLDYSEEDGVACLGLIPGTATHLPSDKDHPVPHMGWNKLQWSKRNVLQNGLSSEDYVYFVHSYALTQSDHTLARCDYSQSFAAIINKDNFYGMQFHPEKSARSGMTLLKNFLTLESLC
ncbi:MAG: imidazole glycerol phosphate synthase subunit HisH [Legionella sp.]|nr:imidazole glycerol phosphate synthase subunit HisH [Legionella sp.]